MTLIKSISGIRGTIGGEIGNNLTPIDIVKFTTAYGKFLQSGSSKKLKVVIGRDARISGDMVNRIVSGTLLGLGIDVLELGLSTTPTVELAVIKEKADGGIIITASHNPKQWNALKLLDHNGEFLSAQAGGQIIELAEKEDLSYAVIDEIGKSIPINDYIQKHIHAVLSLPLVKNDAIGQSNLKIVVDAVNSTGGIAIPSLLRALGVENIVEINCTPNGHFPHNPEPLPEHLKELSETVIKTGADLGIVVDPDVDRLAFVCEDGSMFGEEYTLVAVADYILSKTPGNTVSNLSSTRALRDITESRGLKYEAAAVGEVNVVEKMKQVNAVIGGEGNGGVIYPELHYGRDALVGIGLFLSLLTERNCEMTELRDSFPKYVISKNKIPLTEGINVDDILSKMAEKYKNEEINTIDGVKIHIGKEWVHLRKSNTEPIIRIYSESFDKKSADAFAQRFIKEINLMII